MLTRISTHDTEPTADLDVPRAPRLNLLCGDNGLCSTLLLDLAWWSFTEGWSSYPAKPRRDEPWAPSIRRESGKSWREAFIVQQRVARLLKGCFEALLDPIPDMSHGPSQGRLFDGG